MEIINSRYKIINKINNSISHVQEYLAADLWSGNTKINLKVVSSLDLSKEEIAFFKDNFIIISSIDNLFYLKNYGFSSLYLAYPSLPPVGPDEILYIFTTEYITKAIPVLDFVKKCSMEDILKITIAVCQSLVHASNRGFEYEIFTHDNVMIVEEKDGFKIRIKDIVSTKLENSTSVRFKEAEDYTGTNENIDAVIFFIVTLLTGHEIKTNISAAISKLKTVYKNKNLNKNDTDIFNALYETVKKQTRNNNKNKKIKIHTVIQDINKELNRNYPADIILPLNSITFRPKLVGRQKEINMVSQARTEIHLQKAKKTVFLIKGSQGTGKTRFLKEAEYRLALEGTNIYSNYNFKNSTSDHFWDDFLGKIFLSSCSIQDIAEREKIIKNVKQIRDHKLDVNTEKEYEHVKFKVFNEAKNLFFKTTGKLPVFFIIDDVELANDFILDTIIYLATEITELERLGVILSYDETVPPVSHKFKSFLKILNNYEKCQTFELNDFSKEETIEMLKNTLFLKYPPVDFGPLLYKYTSGCPSFIIEIIKEFVNTETLYRDASTGMWLIQDEMYNEELQKKIPKSIEETLTNQLHSLSSVEKKLFLETSIFQSIFKINYLYKLSNLPPKQIDNIVKKLISKGLITVIKTGDKQEYSITNRIMRDILYRLLDPKHRMLQHKKIAAVLKKEADIDMNELIWHLEESGNQKAVLDCCLDIVEQNIKAKNIDAVVEIYEKIPSVISGQNIINRFKILLKIFELYNQMGLKNKEAEIKLTLEENLPKIKDADLLSHYYNLMARHEFGSLNDDRILEYITKLTELYAKSSTDIINLRLQQAKCLYYHIKQQNGRFKESTHKILKITKNNPEYIAYRIEAYIFLGYLYHRKSDTKKALKCFQKAKELASLSNNIKTELIAMYNISVIYWSIHSDIQKTIAYTKDVITLAKKLSFLSMEVTAIINCARMLSEIQNNDEAYEYAKEAENKIITHNMTMLKIPYITVIMEITQNLNRYKEFYEYRKKYIKAVRETNIKAVYQYNFIFYALMSRMYQEFGQNNMAIACLKKSIKIKKYQPDNKIFMVYFILEALRIIQKQKSDINRLIKIFNSYINTKHSRASNNRKFTKNLFDTIITMIIKRPDIDFSPLIIQVLQFDVPGLHDFQQSGMHYLRTYLDKSGSEHILQENLLIIKPKKLLNVTLFLNTALGDYYYNKGIQSLAIIHYLEAQSKISTVIKNTPEKYRVKLFNNWALSKPFDIVSDFIKGKPATKEKKYNRNITHSELKEILKLKHINIIKKDKKFKNELIQTILRKEGYEHITSVEIINNFTDNYTQNIADVMKFLALNVIASSYDFLEIYTSDEPHFVLKHEDESGNLRKVFDLITRFGYENTSKIEKTLHKPCMVIPVTKHNFTGSDYKLLGFMIFISENVINNFSHEGRAFCKKHSNLLTILIESKNFKQASAFDTLTGAYTRKFFETSFKNMTKNLYNSNSKFSLILYDLDKFKNINDSYGHLIGDIVLKRVTQTILDSLEPGQVLGRYGGEEFTIILPDSDSQKALKAAEYFRKKIENLIFDEFETGITISLGIATFPEHGRTTSELITRADQALYYSKNTGRNRSTIWNPSIISKKSDKTSQTGVLIADESSFGEHISFMIELCDTIKANLKKQELTKVLISKIVKFFEAESGAVILKHINKKTGDVTFKVSAKIGFESYTINEHFVHTVAEECSGICQIDWDEITRRNSITNMPEWNSVMLAPIIKNENIMGIIYLAAPEKQTKFTLNKFNFLKFLTDVISANI
ncbi:MULTISPECIES: diguanylate cyclase [unclassified Treponema]|uniref:diguanylate cyclase n=1 Tax=unclassified Treponema TaxID=2638727 RepID=UPI0020A37A39|nr:MULTISPECIES: diguanylate cyclase [unclassified Treponema]UTC66354.1 diguanylate cyclase [Treponema sp. OMZ 789]UTC69084.1 diguanylate cyclase [Treponema sp. OMZ 790]UTC71796.1 diguanylate cyclase [Treponema sp. OMZ 791]